MICFFLFKWGDALHRSTCRVLEAPISMTLAPGRIEWSFRLSVAVWPLCLSMERRYVCDNTGLYRCGDGCLWSRSWQRRREIKREEGRDGRLVGLSGLEERKTSFILGTAPFEGNILCHLRNILSSSPNTAGRMFILDIYSFFIAYQTVEMCFIWELVNLTHTASPCCASAARQSSPFLPSFSLHIDESVISGGKLLCVWSVAAW